MMYIERIAKTHIGKYKWELFGTYIDGEDELIDGYKYIVRSKSPNSFIPPYEFDTYREATEFIRYIYGGAITESIEKMFAFQDGRDREEIGQVVPPVR